MDLLPDDTLVAVFSLLDIKDLLTCRVVCRRWRDLAGHWDAWCRRTIEWRHLRLAPPCCYELYLDGSWEEEGVLAATVACPAKSLDIRIGGSISYVALASLVIRHQLTLGRLKTLSVYLDVVNDDELSDYSRNASPALDVLANEILDAYKNQKLYVIMKFFNHLDLLDGFLETLSPAVRELEIHSPYILYDRFHRHLENLPNLSRLRSPLSIGLEQVQQSSSIRELEIYLPTDGLDSDERGRFEEVLESTRSALRVTCLTRVTLDYGDYKKSVNATRLVESLGESGKSELTYLEINIADKHKEEIWNEAWQTLLKLEKIQKFVFNDYVYDVPKVVQYIHNMIPRRFLGDFKSSSGRAGDTFTIRFV